MSFREYILYNLQVPPMLLWILSFCIRISHVKVDVAFFMSNINNWHCTLFKFFSLRSRSSALLSIFFCVIQTFIFDQLCWSIFWWNVKTCLSFTFQHATPATLGGVKYFPLHVGCRFHCLIVTLSSELKTTQNLIMQKKFCILAWWCFSSYMSDDVYHLYMFRQDHSFSYISHSCISQTLLQFFRD